MNRKKILNDFIDRFFEKATTKRRHHKNTIQNISTVINNTCSHYLDQKFDFNEDELLDAMQAKGFAVMPPITTDAIIWYTKHGKTISSSGYYVNVKSENISDLVMSIRTGYPLNLHEETLQKIEQLKQSLKAFFKSYK